ncbi:MAG: LptF/LptG family permease, partial [Candidatus Omnitrophota bacterium]
ATDITVYDLDSSGRIINEPRFLKNGILDIRETPEDFEKQRFKIEFMTYRDLSSYIDKLSGISGGVVQKLSVEAHNRLSFPFINLVIILIGAAFALKTKRGSRLRGVAAGFTIGIIFYSVTAISIAFGKGGLLPPIISAWLPNVMFAGWGAYLINQI